MRAATLLVSLAALGACKQVTDDSGAKAVFGPDGRAIAITNDNLRAPGRIDWESLKKEEHTAYNGVGKYGAGCTGTFIDTKGMSGATGDDLPAYFLTNGHCLEGRVRPDVYIVHQRIDGVSIEMNHFSDSTDAERVRIPVVEIVYGTETGTDVALVKAGVTYKALVAQGFKPRKIATAMWRPGEDDLELIQLPFSQGNATVGRDNWHLRRATCPAGPIVADIRLESQPRGHSGVAEVRKRDGLRHRCSALAGSSGAPFLDSKSGEIVAVHFTSVTREWTDDSAPGLLKEENCKERRGQTCIAYEVTRCVERKAPCEVVNGKRIVYVEGNYGAKVQDIPSCLKADGTFDIRGDDCKLAK